MQPNYAGWNDPAQPSPNYPQQAVAFVAGLAAKYGTNPALIGIELLDDPVVSGLLSHLLMAADEMPLLALAML